MVLVRLLARPMLSSIFISGGINALKQSSTLADRAEPVTDRLQPTVERATSKLPVSWDSQQMVRANAVVHIVGGAMLATGRAPRLSALALVATLVPTTFGGHRFWEESDPQQRANQQTHFFKNVSMAGGLLLASVDTEGQPSLAWRARQKAGQARRRADKAGRKAAKRANRLTPG